MLENVTTGPPSVRLPPAGLMFVGLLWEHMQYIVRWLAVEFAPIIFTFFSSWSLVTIARS